jgi:hypothetical protein
VTAIDELNSSEFPGGTLALRESIGLQQHPTHRSRFLPDRSFLNVD